MSTATTRTHDLVLYGATGFTGKLTAEYIAQRYGASALKWALGGRNLGKLERVRAGLAASYPGCADLPLVVADSHDGASLDAMASQTRVICTTVGPYAQYGSKLVAACVTAGTDYCDLAGESQWIRRMIDAHQVAAASSGARIVHCCGFDSIPSDLGTLCLQEEAIVTRGEPAKRVGLYVWRAKGGFSGGTIASMVNLMDEARKDPSARRVLLDPYALNPEGERDGPDRRDLQGAAYDTTIKSWVGPFVMAGINTRIVRRSNALSGYRYGRDFAYSEVMRFGPGLKGRAAAMGFALGFGAFAGAMAVPATRKLLGRWLPDQGQGPTFDAIEKGMFDIRLIGEAEGRRIEVRVRADKDPGYGATAVMLGESAVCLAVDRGSLAARGGVLTPATAMGMTLVERLRAAGVTFEVS